MGEAGKWQEPFLGKASAGAIAESSYRFFTEDVPEAQAVTIGMYVSVSAS